MTISVNHVLDTAALLLQDPANVRWSKIELLNWFNAGQRELLIYKPNANVKITSVPTVAGTLQHVPADCNVFIRITRNMGATGAVEGSAIRQVSHDLLDAQNPQWHLDAATGAFKHYTFVDNAPRDFYVYPRSNGSTQLEMVYSAFPPDAVLDGESILNAAYETALVNYILYRAYGKDADFAMNGDLATKYYTVFTSLLGGRTAGEASV